MTNEEMAAHFEIRLYPISDQHTRNEWAVGVFRKGAEHLFIEPVVQDNRIKAANTAQELARVSGMEIRECSWCQDPTYDYSGQVIKKLLFKALFYGGLLFALYFLAVRFL